ncbi:MAG: hypothetical protein Q8M24_07230 [Pseudolabrys sp.]|nr:hypothetical protein [Pseudolabrys sp.]
MMFVLALPAAAATAPTVDPSDTSPSVEQLPAAEPALVDLFQAFGLFGTYASDCGRPPAPGNPHVSVTQQAGGPVIETHDVGANYAANHYSVRAARRLNKDRLEIKVVFVPGTQAEEFQTLELLVGKGTRRTMFNRVDDGPVRVRRGVAVANGHKTPLLKKCP